MDEALPTDMIISGRYLHTEIAYAGTNAFPAFQHGAGFH